MGTKVSELTALTGAGAATDDVMLVVDTSATTSGSKKITLPELFAAAPVVITTELTGSGAAATDEYLIFDAGVPKTISVLESANALWAGVATEMTGSGAASTDELLFSDAGVSKTITLAEFFATWPAAISTEILGSAIATTDELLVSDAGVPKTITVEELFSALAILGLTLADVPEYADQAAAQTGLSGTGKFWRQTTTGLLGITIA